MYMFYSDKGIQSASSHCSYVVTYQVYNTNFK